MHTNYARTAMTLLAAGALVALVGCGSDDGADAGTLTDEEYLGHQVRDVADDEAPELDFEAEADDHGGWNVHIDADGFEFTPEEVNGEAVGGQGHAHIYVDDTKFARVYSEYYYLPAAAVPEGEHTVTITLNADDHSVWAVDGEAITASASVTGTADDGHDHSHDDDMESTEEEDDADAADEPPEGEDADHVFTYTIADGVADPQLEQQRVEQGSTVRIEVTSEVADELHLHGYDETADVAAGETAVIEFTADLTGRFELETHDSGLTLLHLLVE